MKITVLLENTLAQEAKEKNLVSEHGLSLYIEFKGKRILFDMGQKAHFLSNAKTLGIDLKNVDYAIISHGHYDHGGGLKTFLQEIGSTPIFLQKTAFDSYYNAEKNYIGLEQALKESKNFCFVENYIKIAEGIEIFSCNEKKALHSHTSNNLYSQKESKLQVDNFDHEIYLLLTENKKKILISGCAHKGIINLMEWFEPDVVVGGFHFKGLSCKDSNDREKLEDLAKKLQSYKTKYYTCHCTGEDQFAVLKTILKDSLEYCGCGKEFIL